KGDTAASPVSKENLAIAKSWLASSDEYNLLVNGTAITAFPVYYQNDLALLLQSLRIVQAGTEVAEVKGKDLIPAHGLAMSRLLKTSVFSTEALTYEQAIAYLRKEAIVLPPSVPKGYVLVTYKEIPLGFVKNIGNRANNLYPQEWRIRSGYLPDDIRTL
ncbi:MAG: rRNA cytosine-C5-methyltransferase, partial [Bacteroides fragilis]